MATERDHIPEGLEAGFLLIPQCILDRRDLLDGEKLLLARIWSFGVRGCWQSNQTLARYFGVTARQITTRIARLKAAGCLLWKNTTNQNRTLWARHHPEVLAADALPYRGRNVTKNALSDPDPVTPPAGSLLLPGLARHTADEQPHSPVSPGSPLLPGMEADFQAGTKHTSSPVGSPLPPSSKGSSKGSRSRKKNRQGQSDSQQVAGPTARNNQVLDLGGSGGGAPKPTGTETQDKDRAKGKPKKQAQQPTAEPANLTESDAPAAAESDHAPYVDRGARRPASVSRAPDPEYRQRLREIEAELSVNLPVLQGVA